MDRATERVPADETRRIGRRRLSCVPCSVVVHGLLVSVLFLLPGVVFPGPLRDSPPVVVGHPEPAPSLAARPADPDAAVVAYAPPEEAAAREEPPVEPALFAALAGPPITVVGSPTVERLPPSRTALRKPAEEDGTGTEDEGDPEPEEGGAGDDGEITPPVPLHQPDPPYPDWAERRRIEGSVVLDFTVFTDGTTGEFRIVTSSGHDGLDRAAIRGVKVWTFRPALQRGVPVPYRIRAKITFQL